MHGMADLEHRLTPRLAWVLWLAAGLVRPALAADGALDMDGEGHVELGMLNPGPVFTIEAWVQLDELPTSDFTTVIEAVDPTNARASLYIGYTGTDWQVVIEDANSSESTNCTTDIVDAVCYSAEVTPASAVHVAVSVTATDLKLYVDGVLADHQSLGSAPEFVGDSWAIGSDDDGSGFGADPLVGRVDEVRVWDEVQPIDVIKCLADRSLSGSEDGLYAYYPFEAATTTSDDGSGNGWTATLFGTAAIVASPFSLLRSTGGDVPCYDFDADGLTPGEGDCDDTAVTTFPGAVDEPYDGLDADCDGRSDFDVDGDGSESAAYGGDDCDDEDPAAHPGADDAPYDGLDADCAGDDDFDADGDGDASDAWGGGDCDDGDPAVYLGAPELEDGVDNDCDGVDETVDGDGDGLPDEAEQALGSDPGSPDSDGDGVGDAAECADGADSDSDGAADCLDADDDGDGVPTADEESVDVDGDGEPDPDVDGDGTPNRLDADSDGDGLSDSSEGAADDDADGVPNWADADEAKKRRCGCAAGAPDPALPGLASVVVVLVRRRRARSPPRG